MKGENRQFLLRCLTILLLVPILALTSCRDKDGYKTFTLRDGYAHFYFEYPSSYKKSSAYADIEYRSTVVVFIRPEPRAQVNSTYTFFKVTVGGPTSESPNARTALERELSRLSEPEKLLERSAIIVAGLSAELIVYSHRPPTIASTPAAPDFFAVTSSVWGVASAAAPLEPEMKVTREAYFDYKGLIWNVAIDSDESEADQAKGDFEHILQTFKILD